jgi:dTDP-4-dehydrorhamnose 3,5-epimerase/CDP-3, 6-dideoxy-D-glycero-D-glycero-4-hexulose-5-epimerase
MTIEETLLEGVYIIDNFVAQDERGTFVKTFNKNDFENNHLDFNIRESYFSVSQKDVIRGMHFQLPPYHHEKLVYVPKGKILDVILDLRKNSSTYKKFISIELSDSNKKSVFMPKGTAHGFKALEDNTITVYNVATEYNNIADSGIKLASFGFDWNVDEPIISERDKGFISLKEFDEINPF